MAFHYIATVKKENKNAFRTVANKKADYVTLVGTTSLSTSNEPFLSCLLYTSDAADE